MKIVGTCHHGIRFTERCEQCAAEAAQAAQVPWADADKADPAGALLCSAEGCAAVDFLQDGAADRVVAKIEALGLYGPIKQAVPHLSVREVAEQLVEAARETILVRAKR